jgi:DNA-binding transcriptional ArsR family regulator
MPQSRFDARAISDPKQVRTLASPVRHELVDTLAALGGTASVAQLAEQSGRPADGLYYHLGVLVKARLVEKVEDEERGEQIYRLAGTGKAPLRLAYRAGTQADLSALSQYARGLVKVAQRDFERGLQTPGVALHGQRRQLWAARNKGWVSATELEEVNRLLEKLCELTSKPRRRGRDSLLTLAFVLAPSTRHAKRRRSDRSGSGDSS